MQRPHLLFTPSARGRRWWPGLALGLVALATTGGARRSTAAAPRPGQAYVAGQFLRAVLRGNYPDAYGRLAPEVRRSVSLARFETAARPLWKSGQQHGQRIALYQLGMRLGERGPGQLFYTYSYAADSVFKKPPVLLEVTFRDTAARAVLGFGLRRPGK